MNSPVLKAITNFESVEIPISYAGSEPVSIFHDDLWDFSPHIENKNCKRSDKEINFSIPLNKGCLTSPVYSTLLHSVKGFLYSRLSRPHPRSGKTIKPRTLVGIWFRLRPLIVWMAANEIQTFTKLTPLWANKYRLYVASLDRKPNTVLKRLSVIEMLYDFSDFYPDSLKDNPWPKESSTSISGDRNFASGNQTKEMPEDVFTNLGKTALHILETHAEVIADTLDECFEVIESYRDRAIDRIDSGKSKPIGREREFKIEYLSTRSMRRQLTPILLANEFESFGELKERVNELQTTCYIICALFSGMRDSELASLEVGAYITRTELSDHKTCWLKGMTYKLEDQPTKAEWMVPQCVGQAVYMLERITQYNRRSLNRQIQRIESGGENLAGSKLHELIACRNSLFLAKGNRGYTYRSIDNETVNNRLRKFIAKHNICSGTGQLWPISSHQFRRTFAVFVAKNVMGDLRYLRHHFKHWSMDMTLHYARHKQSDDSLLSDIMSERDKLNRIIVSDWLDGDTPLAGGRGKAITKFKARNVVKTEKSLVAAASNLADGLFIRATGHSWCLANTESCGGQGLYDSIQCASCDSSVIGPHQLEAWKGIREQQQELLALDDLGEPVKHHAHKTIAIAEDIIRGFSGEK